MERDFQDDQLTRLVGRFLKWEIVDKVDTSKDTTTIGEIDALMWCKVMEALSKKETQPVSEKTVRSVVNL